MSNRSKYQDEFPELYFEMRANKFMAKKDIAEAFGISVATFHTWTDPEDKAYKPLLLEAVKRAEKHMRLQVIERTKESLFRAAWGYDFEETGTTVNMTGDRVGKKEARTLKKKLHPSWQACLAILQNIDPENWKDRRYNVIEGKLNIEDIDTVSTVDLLKEIEAIRREAEERQRIEDINNGKTFTPNPKHQRPKNT